METKDMIETLRYKANNIKAHIEPEFFNEVADVLEKQTWISVKDRLPEDNRWLLIQLRYWNSGFNMNVGWYDDKEKRWYCQFSPMHDDDILYWQPLPEPIESED